MEDLRMLAELIEKYKVVNSVGNTIGKVKDIYIDLNTWKIEAFEISPGKLKKDFLLDAEEIVKFDEGDKIIIVGDDFKTDELPKNPRMDLFPFEELKKRHVVDSNGDKVGKIYNLEIPFEKLKVFKVWKILIKTGMSDRRLRLAPSEVHEVMEDISLKGASSDYKEKEE
jgi:sporulation protein YlmC with PRC-barrel domain